MIEDGYDIRTVQELLNHKDVKTRMIYNHVLNRAVSACETRWIPSRGRFPRPLKILGSFFRSLTFPTGNPAATPARNQ